MEKNSSLSNGGEKTGQSHTKNVLKPILTSYTKVKSKRVKHLVSLNTEVLNTKVLKIFEHNTFEHTHLNTFEHKGIENIDKAIHDIKSRVIFMDSVILAK